MAEQEKKGFWDYATPILTGMGAAAATGAYNNYAVKKQNEFNAIEAEKQRLFNAEQAEINRQYETQMSNTAYQRGYADMAAAGLNPHLAGGQGGASTPAGSTATSAAATGAQAMPLDVVGAVNAASNAALTRAQLSNIEADTELKNKNAGKTKADTKYTETMTEIENLKAPLERALLNTQNTKEKQMIKNIIKERDKIIKEMDYLDTEMDLAIEKKNWTEADKIRIQKENKGRTTRVWLDSVSTDLMKIGIGVGSMKGGLPPLISSELMIGK